MWLQRVDSGEISHDQTNVEKALWEYLYKKKEDGHSGYMYIAQMGLNNYEIYSLKNQLRWATRKSRFHGWKSK